MNTTLDIALRVATIIAQVSIPVVIFYAGRKIARAQYIKSTQDAWNEFNKLVIHDENNIRVARQYLGFGWASTSDDAYRKAHLSFVALNALMTVHYGTKHKLLPSDYQQQNVQQILKQWLADDELYELSQTRGYPSEFRELCKKVRSGSPAPQGEGLTPPSSGRSIQTASSSKIDVI